MRNNLDIVAQHHPYLHSELNQNGFLGVVFSKTCVTHESDVYYDLELLILSE